MPTSTTKVDTIIAYINTDKVIGISIPEGTGAGLPANVRSA
jgi:hypothetical protein